MLNLEKHINDLLYHYDCVIVPGLGGFVANKQNAILNDKTGIFTPPRREIGFNRSLSHNDGLLINHIANNEGISFKDCLDKISKHVNILKYQLKCGETIHIGEAGLLKNDAIGNTLFIPNNEQSFCTESFGLTTFHFNTLEQIKKQKEPSHQFVRRTLSLKSSRQIAASIALILGLLFVSPELENRTQQSSFSDFFTTHDHPVMSIESPEIKNENIHIEKSIIEEKPAAIEAQVIENKFFIIGGSFKQKQPAEEFLSKLVKKGMSEAEIIQGSNNRFRVSLSAFVEKEEAVVALNKFREQNGYTSAWLFTKK